MMLMPIPLLPELPPGFFASPTMSVVAWKDDLIDALGFDSRSAYVERYWLGILGPSTIWFLRRVAASLDSSPDGITVDLSSMALELGLGHKGGRHSPFMRTVWRCAQFDMARWADGRFEVRRKLPPLNRRQIARLPDHLRDAHDAWQKAQLGAPAAEAGRRKARSLALTLLEFESDTAIIEQRLASWGVHPAAARDAVSWAWGRHVEARAAAG
ncbi:MAG: hypothetical protein NVS3B12_25380 [Acidimicrobiales bacterium]